MVLSEFSRPYPMHFDLKVDLVAGNLKVKVILNAKSFYFQPTYIHTKYLSPSIKTVEKVKKRGMSP